MLEHGGRLSAASMEYGIPREQWLDLSTGINPRGWNPPPVPDSVWFRLPEDEDELAEAACSYYGTRHLLPVAGSQAAIQALPRLRPSSRVGVVSPSYAEHRHAWQNAGHEVIELQAGEIDRQVDSLEVLVICNPNNPDGYLYPVSTLLNWHRRLVARGGWLIVDEAFMDPLPDCSLAASLLLPGLLVLRSLGKFFGLAGARVGFLLAEPRLLDRLRELLGPWALAGPSRWVASKALRDCAWHLQARAQMNTASLRLQRMLGKYGLGSGGVTPLFRYCQHQEWDLVASGLARQGILVRRFPGYSALRFGLPGREADWQRLQAGLESLAD